MKPSLPQRLNSKLTPGLQSAMHKPRAAYAKQRYNTPLFVAYEMFDAFRRHNTLSLSASLSFYAMFALIVAGNPATNFVLSRQELPPDF